MKPLDRLIQRLRIRQAVRHIPDGARVLDVGCHDGALFRTLGPRLGAGVGIDPLLPGEQRWGDVVLRPGTFPLHDVAGPFDAICFLAVLEHIDRDAHPAIAEMCAELLAPGGRVIVTVPSPAVDTIAGTLRRLRLLDGIELDQHYGLRPDDVVQAFSSALTMIDRRSFELGLNTFLVFAPRSSSVPG